MHVYQKFPCTIDSLRNWPHKKVHENWMQLAVKILWLIKNNQGLLKYSLHSLNLQVYFSKNWLRNFFNLFNIFFTKRQQILGLRNDSSINVHSNNSKNDVMNPECLKYGFCKKSLWQNATLNSWTLSSSQKGTCSNKS